MHISSIKLMYFGGFEEVVTQLVLPLVGNEYKDLCEIILNCSDGSSIVFKYNPDCNADIDRVYYASLFNKKYDSLFGHALNGLYYYFVAYSTFQMSIYNSLDIDLEHKCKRIVPEVQDGYLRWTSDENYPANKEKLVAERIENGVIVPLQSVKPDIKIYNFDYLNIVEVIKKCVLYGKSAYVRVCWYDAYISTEFKFKGALIKKEVPEKKYLEFILVSYDTGLEEIYNSFVVKKDSYDKFKTTLMKSELSGIRYITI